MLRKLGGTHLATCLQTEAAAGIPSLPFEEYPCRPPMGTAILACYVATYIIILLTNTEAQRVPPYSYILNPKALRRPTYVPGIELVTLEMRYRRQVSCEPGRHEYVPYLQRILRSGAVLVTPFWLGVKS